MVDKGGSSDLIVPKISNINKQFYLNNKQIYEEVATFSNYPMYFIQFWIIIDEIKGYFKNQVTNAIKLQKQLDLPDSFIQKAGQAQEAIEKFRSQASSEEIHMIEFLRNNACHLTTSKYHMQWNNKAQNFSKEVNGIYRADIRKQITTELEKHDNDIEKAAKFMANKTYPELQAMFDAIEKWEQEN